MKERILPFNLLKDRERFHSHFLTTTKNIFLNWIYKLLVAPVYFICCGHVIRFFADNIVNRVNPEITLWVQISLWIVSSIPFLMTFSSSLFWRQGFKDRGHLANITIMVGIVLLANADKDTLEFYLLFLVFVLSLGFTKYAWGRRSPLQLVNSLRLFIISGYKFAVFHAPNIVRVLKSRALLSKLIPIILYTIAVLLFVVSSTDMPFILCVATASFIAYFVEYAVLETNKKQTRQLSLLLFVLNLSAVITFVLPYRSNHFDPWLISLAGLTCMLIAANPTKFFSRQRFYVRRFFRDVRYDRIRISVSPTLDVLNIVDRLVEQSRPYIKANKYWLGFVIALIAGGVLAPAFFDKLRDPSHPAMIQDYINAGIEGALFIAGIYVLIVLFFYRQKYVILPFVPITINTERNPQLEAIGNLITFNFVDQLQQIGRLLKLRQVENTNMGVNDPLSLFVTSGQDIDIIAEIERLSTVDPSEKGVLKAIGVLASTIVKILAKATLSGSIQLREDNSIELWLEFSRRGQQTIQIDRIVIPQPSAQDIDEITVKEIAKELAIKLIMSLGQTNHLSSTWISFRHFLDGLNASTERNWWRAGDEYRQAIQIEEASKGTFGIGHFHLGATLMFQGDFAEGIRHLEQSEASGPPLPETQYMLALASLYIAWDELDRNEIVFEGIVNRCEKALALRPHFPEIFRLLGSAYYQRGKLKHRYETRHYDLNIAPVERPHSDYCNDYRKAVKYYRKAISQYDYSANWISKSRGVSGFTDEYQRLTRELNTCKHRLADALRLLGLFSEAASYYRDVLEGYPANITTLIDLCKTYCLAANWQKVDELLSREVLVLPEARWNPDVNMHVGWALIGGVRDFLTHKNTYELLKPLLSEHNAKSPIFDLQQQLRLIGIGFAHIDFAISQRPQYITIWEQTDWLTPFINTIGLLESDNVNQLTISKLANLYNDPINCQHESYLIHLHLWLALRMDSKGFDGNNADKNLFTLLEKLNLTSDDHYPSPQMARSYRQLKLHNAKFIQILRSIEKSSRLHGMKNAWNKLQLGASSLDNWKFANQIIETFLQSFHSNQNGDQLSRAVSFGERWAHDVYAEISIMTVRLLAEARSYDVAWEVTNSALKNLHYFVDECWDKYYASIGQTNFTFSHRMMAHQLATLHAWKAHCGIQMNVDVVAKAHLEANDLIVERELVRMGDANSAIQQVIGDIDNVFAYNPRHPLGLQCLADIHSMQGQVGLAVDELNHLLIGLAPYDPNISITMGLPSVKLSLQTQSSLRSAISSEDALASKAARERMIDQERVSGQKQFEHVLDVHIVHRTIADLLARMDKFELSIRHLIEAILWCPYADVDASNLLLLAQRLEQLDRFEDAQSIINSLRANRRQFEKSIWSVAKVRDPDVIDCILKSRMSQNSSSLELAQKMFRFTPLKGRRQSRGANPNILEIGYRPRLLETGIDKLQAYYDVVIEIMKKDGYRVQCLDDFWRNAKDQRVIEGLLSMAELYLRPKQMANLLFSLWNECNANPEQSIYSEEYSKDEIDTIRFTAPFLDIKWNMMARITNFISVEALRLLEQYCQINNIMVFNIIELNLIEFPPDRNVMLMVQSAINIMLRLTEFSPPNIPAYSTRYTQYLAQFYDTKSWYLYRCVDPRYIATLKTVTRFPDDKRSDAQYRILIKMLETARNVLSDEALYYDQRRSIIHYHITRIYLTMLERMWQGVARDNREIAQVSSTVNEYLSEALRHWLLAKRNDVSGHMNVRLARLGRKISQYQTTWHVRHLKTFGGT